MEKDGYKELFIVTESFLKDVEKNVEKLAALKEEKSVNTQTEKVLPQQPQPPPPPPPPTVDTLPQASSSSSVSPPIEQQQPQQPSLPSPPSQPVSNTTPTTTTQEEQVNVGGVGGGTLTTTSTTNETNDETDQEKLEDNVKDGDKNDANIMFMKKPKCKFCSREFTTEEEVAQHIIAVHKVSSPFLCRLCEKSFKTDKDLNHHIKQKHIHSLPKRLVNTSRKSMQSYKQRGVKKVGGSRKNKIKKKDVMLNGDDKNDNNVKKRKIENDDVAAEEEDGKKERKKRKIVQDKRKRKRGDDDDDDEDDDDDDFSTYNIRQTRRRRIRPRLSSNLPVSVFGDNNATNMIDLTDPQTREKRLGKLPLADAHSEHSLNRNENKCNQCDKTFPTLLQLSRHLYRDHDSLK